MDASQTRTRPLRFHRRCHISDAGAEPLVADIHVVVVGSVDLGLVRPGRAVALGGLGRRQGVRVLPVLPLPLLLAVVALLFLVVISGDLLRGGGGRQRVNTLPEQPDSQRTRP